MRIFKFTAAAAGIIAPVLVIAAEVYYYTSVEAAGVTPMFIILNALVLAEAVFAAVQFNRLKAERTMLMPAAYGVLTAFTLWLGCGLGWEAVKMLAHLPPYGLTN